MKKMFALLFTGFLVFLTSAVADTNKGSEKMELSGGKKGKVPFPHHHHQNTLGDCNKCHGMFPQESGSIENMKDGGKLKKMTVMRELCIQCHKAEKKAGRSSGPIKCSECHVK